MAEPYHVWPDITIDGTPLSRQADEQLEQVVIDHHQHLPDMFLITFHDPDRDVIKQIGVQYGSAVVIKVAPPDGASAETLIDGEITAVEADYDITRSRTLIRGYDKSHRLHRGRTTKTYKNVTDSDIVRQVLNDNGVPIGQIDSTSITYDHVSQANQSGWEFIQGRAAETNYEMGMEDGKFYYRKPVAASGAPQTGDYQSHSDPCQLVFGDSLLEFRARVTSAEQVSTVKVRGWDPEQKQAVIGSATATTVAAVGKEDANNLAGTFAGPTFTVVNRPLDKQPMVDGTAAAVKEAIASSFAEADGLAVGNPKLKAGSTISIGVAGEEFSGKYTLTSTRHIFDETGYRTNFVVSGRQDRTLLGLASKGTPNGHHPAGGAPINGVVIAQVTDNNDPKNQARVKLKFPWLDDDYESDWARVVQLGAGPNSGALFMPEVNDEVLVAFEHGDIRRPFVVGSLYNGKDTPNLGSSLFNNGKVARRGLVSRLGHMLIFFDDDDNDKKGIALISSDGSYKISLNQSKQEIHISSQGKVTIESQQDMSFQSQANVTIKAQQGISMEASGGTLDLKGMTATLKSSTPSIAIDNGAGGKIELNGPEVNVNSGALQVM